MMTFGQPVCECGHRVGIHDLLKRPHPCAVATCDCTKYQERQK